MPHQSPDIRPQLSRPNPRFIAGLIAVSALVLGVGAALRPQAKQAVTTAVPSNELATLPERSQRRALRDLAEYVNDRAATFSRSVVYLPEHGASALALTPDSILTVLIDSSQTRRGTRPAVRVLLTRPSRADSALEAAPVIAIDTLPSRWGVVVARTLDGRTLSLAGLTGGLIQTFCGELGFREVVFDAPVPLAFRGGGLFDLDGNTLAQAVPCDGRIALVPISDLTWTLNLQPPGEPQ